MSKYNSLMDYLDAQDSMYADNDTVGRASSRLPSPPSYRNHIGEPAASSVPSSPPGYSSRRQYVWDEVDHDHSPRRPPNDVLIPPLNISRTNLPTSRSEASSSSQDSSSISEMVQAVRMKVDAMKVELRNRSESVRELQTELARVRNAKDRKEEKLRKIWESRLNDLKDEQNKMLRRQKDFLDKLTEDCRTLGGKDSALREKIFLSQSGGESVIQRTMQEGQRKKDRARAQWYSDEKIAFEKVLASKMENMKIQAAKSMGLKLDATVMEYKEISIRAAEDIEHKLVQLKSSLQAELQVKYSEALDKMKEEDVEDEDRQRRIEARTMDEAKKRQDVETSLFKEKLLRNRSVLEDKLDRVRKDESASLRNGVQRTRDEGSKQLRDVQEAHQRALAASLRSSGEARVKAEAELREELDNWEREYRRAAREKMDIQKRREKDLSAAKTAAETERIVVRLRVEAEEERRVTARAIERESEEIKNQAQGAIDAATQSDIRSSEQLSNLRADVRTLKLQLDPVSQSDAQQLRECSEGRSAIQALRNDLHDAEERLALAEARSKGMDESKDGDNEELALKIRAATNEGNNKKAKRAACLRDAKISNEDEFMRVRKKVGVLLDRKAQSMDILSCELSDLREECSALEKTLEELRLKEH